jgi:hypothetical protein
MCRSFEVGVCCVRITAYLVGFFDINSQLMDLVLRNIIFIGFDESTPINTIFTRIIILELSFFVSNQGL